MPDMATPPPTPRLLGREAELQALGERFDQVASGHLTTVVVEGRQVSARPGCLPRPSTMPAAADSRW
jgi:hypothetical protein